MSHQTKSQKAKAETRALPEAEPEFQIAPMIDILLVLLVFFMTIATDQVLQVSKDVTLPVAKDAKEPDSKEIGSELIVNVIWNEIASQGAIRLGETDIEIAQLHATIDAKKKIDPNLRVIIRGDKSVKYEYIKSVMQTIGKAGVPNVIFSAVDKEMQK